jgi:hypothetical protein
MRFKILGSAAAILLAAARRAPPSRRLAGPGRQRNGGRQRPRRSPRAPTSSARSRSARGHGLWRALAAGVGGRRIRSAGPGARRGGGGGGLRPAGTPRRGPRRVGRRIRWRRDLDTYHVSDYWAQAGETLTRGEGDSEDIAILKMQVLKAAGFAPRDIYLSVGRDRRAAPTRCCWCASATISTPSTTAARSRCAPLAARGSSR